MSKEVKLSVDESNALRQKLGLKTLNESAPKERHVTVIEEGGPSTQKKADKDADLRAERGARGKRARDALTKGGGIADRDGEEDADAWVKKVRSGGGGVLPKQKKLKPERDLEDGAEAKALSQMRVRHDAADILEGSSMELTLADEPMLNPDGTLRDDEGALENTQMRSKYRGQRNNEIRMEALKSTGMHDERSTKDDPRNKYDDLPEEPEGFVLGMVKKSENVAAKLEVLNQNAVSLDKELKFQSDFLQSHEIKPRKLRKVKKRAPLETEKKQNVVMKGVAAAPAEDSGDEDAWLYEQLSRQRRILRKENAAAKEGGDGAERAAAEVVKEDAAPQEAMSNVLETEGLQTVTGTTEFCKNVQTAQEKLDSRRYESFTGAIQFKQQQLARQRRGVRFNATKKRLNEEGLLESEDDEEKERDKEETRKVLSEDVLDKTTASAIAYLRSRNDILNDQDNHRTAKGDNIPLEMGGGKDAGDGRIRLERRDEFGRVMTPKEAFQQMSWVFHGKRPGNKNETKRMLRLEQELKNRAAETESTLPTLRALRHVQKEGKAHVQLTSGVN